MTNITVRRTTGNSFECLSGHMRLQVGLHMLGKVHVTDVETGETLTIHEVDGEMIVLEDGRKAIAETIASDAIEKARKP